MKMMSLDINGDTISLSTDDVGSLDLIIPFATSEYVDLMVAAAKDAAENTIRKMVSEYRHTICVE